MKYIDILQLEIKLFYKLYNKTYNLLTRWYEIIFYHIIWQVYCPQIKPKF